MIRQRPSSEDPSHPAYWFLLSDSDKAQYRKLQQLMDPLSIRTTRDQASVKFQIILSSIHRFAVRRDGDDWRRCLVCGMGFLHQAIAVNTRQMSALTGRCKSSINASFQELGYLSGIMSRQLMVALVHIFPNLARNCSETREWTIRQLPPIVSASIRRPLPVVTLPDEPIDFVEDYTDVLMDADDLSVQDDDDDIVHFASSLLSRNG
jgi:hypothetical protein